MDFSELEREEELMKGYIDRFYDKSNKKSKPITDGIVDIKQYLKSKYRICWVLKEAYDEDNGKGGGWSLIKEFLAKDDYTTSSPTWQPIIYTTYSLLNDFMPWSEMDKINGNPKISKIVKNIAFINVNKMPASHRSCSNDNEISKKYEIWRPLLHWQLKIYDPQIIIFGNTFQHFQKDLGIKDNEIKKKPSVNYVVKKNKIYVHAYHPGQRGIITRENYIQGIINIIKMNIEKI